MTQFLENSHTILKQQKYFSHTLAFPFMDHSLVVVTGLAQLSEAMSHAMQGHSRWTSHNE